MSVKREVVHICASRFELIKMVQTFLYRNRTGLPMKRLMICAFAAVALFAAATTMLWSHSPVLFAGTAAMPSLEELHTAAGVNKLPIEDFEDMSLVYSTKR
jgi:fatty acid desaturase